MTQPGHRESHGYDGMNTVKVGDDGIKGNNIYKLMNFCKFSDSDCTDKITKGTIIMKFEIFFVCVSSVRPLVAGFKSVSDPFTARIRI